MVVAPAPAIGRISKISKILRLSSKLAFSLAGVQLAAPGLGGIRGRGACSCNQQALKSKRPLPAPDPRHHCRAGQSSTVAWCSSARQGRLPVIDCVPTRRPTPSSRSRALTSPLAVEAVFAHDVACRVPTGPTYPSKHIAQRLYHPWLGKQAWTHVQWASGQTPLGPCHHLGC